MALKIAFGSDHAGFKYKKSIFELLRKQYQTKDFGTFSSDSVDYPDFVHPVALGVSSGEFDFGILVCGSGQGVAMTANKHQNIRAALCWQKSIAELGRLHNNANILCLPARFISVEQAQEIAATFLKTNFEGGRHQRRIDKISY